MYTDAVDNEITKLLSKKNLKRYSAWKYIIMVSYVGGGGEHSWDPTEVQCIVSGTTHL